MATVILALKIWRHYLYGEAVRYSHITRVWSTSFSRGI
jgi:hypothetical protein